MENPKNNLGHGKGWTNLQKGKGQGKTGGIFQKNIEHIDEGEKEQGVWMRRIEREDMTTIEREVERRIERKVEERM